LNGRFVGKASHRDVRAVVPVRDMHDICKRAVEVRFERDPTRCVPGLGTRNSRWSITELGEGADTVDKEPHEKRGDSATK